MSGQNLTPLVYNKHPMPASDVEYIVLPDAERASEKSLHDYLQIFWKRKRLVIAPALLIIPLTFLLLVFEKPSYQAVATVLIEDVNPRVMSIQDVVGTERSPDFYKTQYELIKLREVVEEVVDTLQLDKAPPAEVSPVERVIQSIQLFPVRLIDTLLASMKAWMGETGQEAKATNGEGVGAKNPQRKLAVFKLQKAIKVTPREGTKLVDIALQGERPGDVTKQVNMIASIYARRNVENKLETSKKAIDSLRKEAETLKEKVRSAEVALQTFKDKKKIIIPENGDERRNTTHQKLDALHASYAETNASRLILLSRLNELRQVAGKNLEEAIEFPEIAENQTIRALKARYVDLKAQIVNLSNKYREKHPEIIRVNAEIDNIRGEIRSEIKKMLQGVEKEYQTLSARYATLESAVNAQKDEVINFGKDVTTYNELKHNIEVEKELFLAVSKRLAETTLTESIVTNNVKTIESAIVPDQPVPSWKIPKLFLGLLLSLGCGAGLALLAERRDKRLQGVEDVEKYLDLPFLGFIPRYKVERGKEYKLIALHEPASLAAESYRMVRTLLQSSQPSWQTLVVTSATPDEGKSTTTANLAVSFAQLGKAVLVVDADLRNPSLHRLFEVAGTVGLADVLLGGIDWRAGLQKTHMENLQVLPAGVRPPNPSELLSSQRMQWLLKRWKERFDVVIFDSPIITGLPDVAILAPVVEGVLFVHYPTRGDKAIVLEAKRLLDRVGARCIGVVFNKLSTGDKTFYGQRYSHAYYATQTRNPAASQWGSADFIDMRPEESRVQWHPASARGAMQRDMSPMEFGRSAQSRGLNIALKGCLLQHNLDGTRSTGGYCFLTLDLEIYNSTDQPHLFDPALTTVTAGQTRDYSQALAAQLALPKVDPLAEIPSLQSVVCSWDPQTQAIEKGITTVEPLEPKRLKRGRLVYQVPEEAALYTFGYENGPIRIAIPIAN